MCNRYLRIAVAVALFFAATTFAPAAQAVPENEITTTYYDACLNDLFTRVIDCSGNVWTSSGSSAGAVYKEVEQMSCEGVGHYVTWYQNVNGTWVQLSGPPSGC